MKKVHTDEQIVGIMSGYEGSGQTVKEYCRTKGIHETTYYAWKKRFGSMEVGEVRELRSLQAENARLKRLLADDKKVVRCFIIYPYQIRDRQNLEKKVENSVRPFDLHP